MNTSKPDIIEQMRFFGYNKEKDVVRDGTNAKMTEIHAAVGLASMGKLLEEKRLIRHNMKMHLEQVGLNTKDK